MVSSIAAAAKAREHPHAVVTSPGPRHWSVFLDLCRKTGARGNLVADAYGAALAIEPGSEWITTDRDCAQIPGLRWRHPLAQRASGPCYALVSASMSSFFILRNASTTLFDRAGSAISLSSTRGTTCQLTPNLSLSQPH